MNNSSMQLFKTSRDIQKTGQGVRAALNDNWNFQIDVLESWLIRISLMPREGFTLDRTWMIAPKGDTPWEGNPKLFTKGFSCPRFAFQEKAETIEIKTDLLQVSLKQNALQLAVSQLKDGQYNNMLQDRKTGAYYLANHGQSIRHYQATSENERHFGLGDKAGPLDRSGKRFRVLQLDALGYNAETSDPLYKHIPFMIVQDKASNAAVGVLYDSMSEMVFDLGCEHSNYHQQYRYVEAYEKGLVYYIIGGPRVSDVVKKLSDLTGRPHLQPRWSMGFAFTSMYHADAPDAQKSILNFAQECRSRKIPISAIHFGSGYTTRGKLRYVFTWNQDKFPDRKALFTELKRLGLYTVANTKPVLLTDHPAYQDASDKSALIKNPDGSPAVGVFWDADGSYLDFTNQAGIEWWQNGARKAVLEEGFDAIWNDNNETEIWDETAEVNNFGSPVPAVNTRSLQSHLMTRASYEITSSLHPKFRPYTITRAGCIGLQRYAETWTGDNKTSWHTLKWNLCNGLSLGLSGIPFAGHDIGGFTGPSPNAELLIRWTQMMALHPRCVMNSWKPQSEHPANLPWLHEEATDIVRNSLELRYRFLPYLYNLAYQAHMTGEPIIRPLFYDYEDPRCFEEIESFLLGSDVFVAPVVEEGKRTVSVYLPENKWGWFNYHTEKWFEGGQVIVSEAELDCLPLFVQAGAVLPLAVDWDIETPHDAQKIELRAYCPSGLISSRSDLFYDDGLTWEYKDDEKSIISYDLKSDNEMITLAVNQSSENSNLVKLQAHFVGSNKRKTRFNLSSNA